MFSLSLKSALVAGVLAPTLSFGSPGKLKAPVDEIFIPVGFDSNDNVEVVLHGDFNNSCARITSTSFEVDQKSKRITVDAEYLQYDKEEETAYCMQVILPFIEVVKLGVLPKGEYQVVYAGSDAKANLVVEEAKTESPDDFLYAPVENAWVDVDVLTGRQSLVIQGSYPLWFVGCQVVKEIRVENQNNVLLVLPITEVVDDDSCQREGYNPNFKIRKGLTAPLHREGLLHVRTMHSNSVNRYIPAP